MSIGVAGFTDTPAFTPSAFIALTSWRRSGHTSAWTVMIAAPALANCSSWRSGLSIIRWTSRGISVHGRMAATTTDPMVIGGTNWPSITSTWM